MIPQWTESSQFGSGVCSLWNILFRNHVMIRKISRLFYLKRAIQIFSEQQNCIHAIGEDQSFINCNRAYFWRATLIRFHSMNAGEIYGLSL